MKLPPLRDPDSISFRVSGERAYFALRRPVWLNVLTAALTIPAVVGTLLIHQFAAREIRIPDAWIHAWWLLCLAAGAAWLAGSGVIVDGSQKRVIWWRGLRFGIFNLEFKLQAWPLNQLKQAHLYAFTPPGSSGRTQYAVDLKVEGGPCWRLSARGNYLRQRGEAERIAKTLRIEMCDDTYVCASNSIVRRCEELDEPFHIRMTRLGKPPVAQQPPSSPRFEIKEESGVLQIQIGPKKRGVLNWIASLLIFPLILGIVLLFLGLIGSLIGAMATLAYKKHWGFIFPCIVICPVFVVLLGALRDVVHEGISFLFPAGGKILVSAEGLNWSRRSWPGERKLPAAEIEELYVSAKGDLIALTDRTQLMIEMELTKQEGEWLCDTIVARFCSQREQGTVVQSSIDIPAP